MPAYDYACACGNLAELFHPMAHCDREHPCPCCGRAMSRAVVPVAVKPPPDSGWEGENDGRGRYIAQLADHQPFGKNDPKAYCRSQSDAIEKGKRKGFTVSRAR